MAHIYDKIRCFHTFEYFPFNFWPSFKNLFKSVDSFWNFNTNLNFPHEKSQIPNFPSSFFFPQLEITFELLSQRITIQIQRACNPVKICKWAQPSSNSLSQSYSEKFPRQIFEGTLPIAVTQINGSSHHSSSPIRQMKIQLSVSGWSSNSLFLYGSIS